MEEKVVRFEIGKVLAVIITIVAVAIVASAVIRSDYFKGSVSNCIEPHSGSTAEMWAAYNDCLTRESLQMNTSVNTGESAIMQSVENLGGTDGVTLNTEENTDSEAVLNY